MNQTNEKIEVNIVGSTFTGLLKRKHIKHSLANKSNGDNIILQLIKFDRNISPAKLRFSNENIDDQDKLDKSLIVNTLSEEGLRKNQINVQLYENVQSINENYIKDENDDELKAIETNIDNIDYESLLKRDGVEEEGDEEEEEEEHLNREEEEQLEDIEELQDTDNLLVNYILILV
jgi:hypothetical protein